MGRAELFILWVTVGATLLRGGWEGAVVKVFGAWTSSGERHRVREGFQKWTRFMVAIGIGTAGFGWLVLSDVIPGGSKWLGGAMGAWVVIGWLAEALRGTGHVSTYALFQPGWWMLFAGLIMALGCQDATLALGISAVLMAGMAFLGVSWWFRRRFTSQDLESNLTVAGQSSFRPMARLAIPIWLGSVLHLVLSWADTAMLSAWLTEVDVAHYRAAFRLAALLTFTQFAVNALGAPTFGALHAAGEKDTLRKAVHRIGWMNTAVAVPGFLFLLLVGPWALSLWGPAFARDEAITALMLLAGAQALNALSGPVMYLLNMTGEERSGLIILGISAVTQIVAGRVWVPEYGLVGAAASAALGMAAWNLIGVAWVRRQHGFWMVSLWNGWWRRG